MVQAALSLRLHNSAFQDEALYLTAGHEMREHLVNGHPVGQYDYTSYFSGSPYLYPALVDFVQTPWGLAGARAVSLCFMLGATALLYSFTRRLWDERTGLCAAGAFAVTESTQMLGNFATFDAPAIFMLALTAWLVVRSRTAPYLLLPAVGSAALAVGVKYAAALYLPTLCAMVVLVAMTSWPRALLRGMLFALGSAASMYGLLAWLGAFGALSHTTTARVGDGIAVGTMLWESAQWGGLWFLLAVVGAVAAVRSRPARVRSRLRGGLLSVVLCLTALLAPIYQIHLQVDTSLSKHIGFGLLFAAPLTGVALSGLAGSHFKFPLPAIAASVGLLLAGTAQADRQYSAWARSDLLMSELWKVVPNEGGHNLSELAEVPAYYLRARTRPENWTSMYFFQYGGQEGLNAYLAAMNDGFFDVIVLDRQANQDISLPLESRLRDDPRYRLLARIPFRTSAEHGDYEVWSKTAPTQ